MYLNYDTATRIVTKRSDKHAGASLRGGYYLKFFPDLDVYMVQELDYSSKWIREEIEGGGTKYVRAAKSAWTFHHRATLFRDGSVTLSSGLRAPFLRDHWGLRIYKSKSVAERGYFAQRNCEEAVNIGPLGATFKLDENRHVVRLVAPLERVVDKAKQKEIRAEIKRALRIITVREKLGAYGEVRNTVRGGRWSVSVEESKQAQLAGLLIYNASVDPGSNRETKILDGARALYQLVKDVDDSKLESADPLIKIALRHAHWHCFNERDGIAFSVKRLLDSRMRMLYQALGAETFVPKEC